MDTVIPPEGVLCTIYRPGWDVAGIEDYEGVTGPARCPFGIALLLPTGTVGVADALRRKWGNVAFLRVSVNPEGETVAVPAEVHGETFRNGGNLVLGTKDWPFEGTLHVYDRIK